MGIRATCILGAALLLSFLVQAAPRTAGGPVARPATQPAQTQPTATDIERLFEARDLVAVQRLHVPTLAKLPANDRNRIALAAARSLKVKGVNHSAAEILRDLARERGIDDPQVVPYLVAALDDPDRHWVAARCFHALQSLTRHMSGDVYWSRMVEDANAHESISKWWKTWCERNKDRHPIFTRELETQSRDLVLAAAQVIESYLKPEFPALGLFEVPRDLRLQWRHPLFCIDYNPGHWAMTADMGRKLGDARKPLPWICILCRFGSEDLPGTPSEEPRCPEELKGALKTCFSQRIEGTDVIVEVLAASTDDVLLTRLSAVLSAGVPALGAGCQAPASQPATAFAERTSALIAQLGSDKYQEREAAQKELVGIGVPALLALRSAARDKDAERAYRAKATFDGIMKALARGAK